MTFINLTKDKHDKKQEALSAAVASMRKEVMRNAVAKTNETLKKPKADNPMVANMQGILDKEKPTSALAAAVAVTNRRNGRGR